MLHSKRWLYFNLCLLVSIFLFSLPIYAGTLRGKISATGIRKPENIVVYLKGVQGNFPPPAKPLILDQKDFVFIPHILPLVRGTTVTFSNHEEKIQHNIFSPDSVADHMNLGTYPPGQSQNHKFDKGCEGDQTCVAVILCNVHAEMSAYVVILDNPYFSVTNNKGEYEIPNTPEGSFTLVAWHEKLKETQQPVTLSSGVTEVNLSLKK